MRKANGARTPKHNAKQTNPLAKSGGVNFQDGGSKQHTVDLTNTTVTEHPAPNQPPAEDDLMGGSGQGSKSDVMDKNLLQMFDVLRHRLDVLKEAATTRAKLCEEDTNKNSDKMSEQAPKIIDEFDEVVPRSLRDIKMPTLAHKDNLVASDTVYIDPFHLVFSKTKVPTEAAKNLEAMLEESFGNINMRETKNKKSKAANQTEKSKKSEQLKNEAKRINRMKLERKLTQNMDQFLTRSVMDGELRFEAPILVDAPTEWPVTIKWCSKDPRSKLAENIEGEFDPDLLLRYAIERINLPSGKRLFSFLVRQAVIQRYFVSLFWLLKVKFFESDNTEDSECYLLRLLSIEYRRIVELLASRAHAEHEKDFAFKYLPFILTNGVYFGFYYVFPGSRHIYTKGFKKTIYMQIIQVMHGIQMCPSSVKVAWAKLFPEDTHEDGEEVEEGGESFPVLIALKGPRGALKTASSHHTSDDEDSTGSHSSLTSRLKKSKSFVANSNPNMKKPEIMQVEHAKEPEEEGEDEDEQELGDVVEFPVGAYGRTNGSEVHVNDHHFQFTEESRFHRPNLAKGHIKGGFLSDMHPEFGHHVAAQQKAAAGGTDVPYAIHRPPAALANSNSASASALISDSLRNHLTRRGSSANLEKSAALTAQALASMALNKPQPAPPQLQQLARSVSQGDVGRPLPPMRSVSNLKDKSTITTEKDGIASRVSSPTRPTTGGSMSTFAMATKNPGKHTVHGLMNDPIVQGNMNRTYLKPLAEKPHRQRHLVRRQNVFEAMDAHSESPQMQLYLFDAAGAKPAVHSHIQAFHRTIPIGWCATGGADTHRKIAISTDLHAEISSKLRRSEHELAQSKTDYHKEKIRTVVDTKNALGKVLSSGPTNISRFSLDLIRRQRSGNKENPPPVVEDVVMNTETTQQLLFYTDEEMEKLLNDI